MVEEDAVEILNSSDDGSKTTENGSESESESETKTEFIEKYKYLTETDKYTMEILTVAEV